MSTTFYHHQNDNINLFIFSHTQMSFPQFHFDVAVCGCAVQSKKDNATFHVMAQKFFLNHEIWNENAEIVIVDIK